MALFSSRAPCIASVRPYRQPDTNRVQRALTMTSLNTACCISTKSLFSRSIQRSFVCMTYCTNMSARPTVPTCFHYCVVC